MNLAELTIEQQQRLNALKELNRHTRHTPEHVAALYSAAQKNVEAAQAILNALRWETHAGG